VEKLNVRERAEVVRAFSLTSANRHLEKLDAQAAKLESALKSSPEFNKPSHVGSPA